MIIEIGKNTGRIDNDCKKPFLLKINYYYANNVYIIKIQYRTILVYKILLLL